MNTLMHAMMTGLAQLAAQAVHFIQALYAHHGFTVHCQVRPLPIIPVPPGHLTPVQQITCTAFQRL